ncbi:MAG: extracellular solute-binding protein [Chloroflexi bacterium]|nr:extracellular solute-binding protein [Chloroflexota bacterium]
MKGVPGRRITKRRVLAGGTRAALAAVAPVLAAACDSTSSGSASQGQTTRSAPQPVRLLYWNAFPPEHLQSLATKAVLEDFQAKNPGRATVEVGEGGTAANLAKIKAAVAANTPPNLWSHTQYSAADLSGIGALVDLNVALKTHKDWGRLRRDVIPALIEGSTWKDRLTMVPLTSPVQLLGFNKQMLLKAGVPLPKPGFTWNEFLEIGRKAAQPPEVALFDYRYTWPALLWWMYANGQRSLSADRTKLQFTAPAAHETLEWLHEQVTRTQLARNGAPNFNQGQSVTETINANAVTGPRFPDVDPGDGRGIHVIHYPYGPRNTKKEPLTYGNTYGFAVFRSAEPDKEAAAADVAAWSVRPDVQVKVMEVSLTPPTTLTALKESSLPARIKENPILKALNDGARYVYLTPNFPNWNEATNILDQGLGRVGKGELRPRDALADAQTKMQALLDEDLRRGG